MRVLPLDTRYSHCKFTRQPTLTPITQRTLPKSPPISCLPQSTMVGILDKGKQYQQHHHHHATLLADRYRTSSSHGSSQIKFSSPTSHRIPPAHQHLTPHSLPRRHARVATSPTYPLLPTHHLQALPIHPLHAMHPYFGFTQLRRHPNHPCNPCTCSSQASHQNLNLFVAPHPTLFSTQAINISTAGISRHSNGVRRLKVIQVCRCPCHPMGYKERL